MKMFLGFNHVCFVLNSESLYEDEEFDQHQRQLAALLVSKVLYG